MCVFVCAKQAFAEQPSLGWLFLLPEALCVPPITTPLEQSQMQDEDPSPNYSTGSASMECPYLQEWLKIWSVGFSHCPVNHVSPADNCTALWVAVTVLGPLLTGCSASD